MKHTVSLGHNKFLQLDSYGESHKTRRVNNFIVVAIVFGISIITVPALFGIDITNIQPIQHYDNTKH